MKILRTTLLVIQLVIAAVVVKSQAFTNPILAGYYPDPSICRAGDDFYLVNSSFAFYPGLPLFHSKDLLNWKQIGYALDRPEQLDLEGHGVSRGLFAPSITYHEGLFYIVCTKVDKVGNFVITAKDPKGPWTNPVSLPEVNGIDPALFFDDNKACIVYNSIPPDNKSLYNGHRTIRMREFDAASLKTIGEEKILVNGGTDINKKPVWIEAPHIIKRDGWYYLICAEGGTGYNHSEVIFRSKSVDGPYISYEKNPILTQRHLDTLRKHPITTTGHADFVEGKDGKWWAVFLGCRPYEGDFYNTGRETFMAPVEWKDGWLQFNLGGDEVKYSYPINATIDKNAEKFNGNYLFRDEFNPANLNVRYNFLRTVKEEWYSLWGGALTINVRPETCGGKSNPSFIGFHQPHLKGYAATSMRFIAASENEKAGLLIFQNEKNHYFLCQSLKDGKQEVQLYKGNELISSRQINVSGDGLQLKIEAKNDKYAFWYADKKGHWQLLMDNVDGKYLSTKVAGGFVGCLYTMYATSNGNPSTNKAVYDWFECKSDDDVYKVK
ncbi:MAG TPA: glycoside hydrolase family 43 protein [Chitinophagaceae bacterium]|nr:glycoside hydrolase family 43 protein [Chitinophagaceae bacterium]